MTEPFGFLAIDKPKGVTSHDCVKEIRKIFNIKRVGHGGTLDPNVTGVLPIAIGCATRLLPYFPGEKTYVGSIQLGTTTTTDDLKGEVLSQKKWPLITEYILNKYLDRFRGKIQQKPPRISSVHIKGERAYKRAKKGESFDLPSKEVTIHQLNLIDWNQISGLLEIEINCSSGTYIRSIARDLGNEIGCGGCLKELRRTKALGFKEDKLIQLSDYKKDADSIKSHLINPIEITKYLPYLKLEDKEYENRWRTGQKIIIRETDKNQLIFNNSSKSNSVIKVDASVAIMNSKGEIVGIAILIEELVLKPRVVFNAIG